jgi:hypothetical protein
MKTAIALLCLLSTKAFANIAIVVQENVTDGKTILAGELNIYRNTVYNNWALMQYGKDWIYGIKIANINIVGAQLQNYENDTYANLSRKFSYKNIILELGGQAGYNFSSTSAKKLHATTFLDISYGLSDNVSLHFGGYYVNDELATKHQPYNFQAGIKYKISQFIITGDYYSGNNNLSGGMINVYYKLTNTIRPYIGIIVPETNSGNEFAGITGVTWKVF